MSPEGAELVDQFRASLPELPAARRHRFAHTYGLKPELAKVLAGSKDWSDFFEETVGLGAAPVAVSNWMTQDLAALAKTAHLEPTEGKVTPRHLADVVRLVEAGTISTAGAKAVLEDVFASGREVEEVVEQRSLRQVSDTAALGRLVEEVLAENPEPVVQFKGGKEGALQFLVGQLMKKTRGSANPQVARDLLRERLTAS